MKTIGKEIGMQSHRTFLKEGLFAGLTTPHIGLLNNNPEQDTFNKAIKSIDIVVQNEINKGLFPGAVIAGGKYEGFHFIKAYGHARIVPEFVPMYEDTLFDLESLTKVIGTSTALTICIDNEIIDINAPARHYLRDFSGKGTKDILIRHLVTHTSGYAWGRVCNGEKICDFFANVLNRKTDHEVGVQYMYSNINAILTGMIIESIVNESFGDYCLQKIFKPLKMHDTLFSPIPNGYNIAASRSEILYVAANEDVRSAGRQIGTAGLFSTAYDLTKFCRVWLGEGAVNGVKLFSKDSWNLAISNLSHDINNPIGVFWKKSVKELDRPTQMSIYAFGHSGYTGQSIWIDPRKDIYTIVLTNRNHPKLEKSGTLRGKEQYLARGRIADSIISVFE